MSEWALSMEQERQEEPVGARDARAFHNWGRAPQIHT